MSLLYFHPQRGVYASPKPINPRCARSRGGPDDAWVALPVTVDSTTHARTGELPLGFLWGDPAKQKYGMGGPTYAYGPLERRCRACGADFTFTAKEQQHWYEVLGFTLDSTAVKCAPCRAAERKEVVAQRRYDDALTAASARPGAATHLAVAEAVLALMDVTGRAPSQALLDKALAHCTAAKKCGAGDEVARVRKALRARAT